MEIKSFHALIEAEIEFTRKELLQLCKLSAIHYDGKCSAAGRLGGFLYGFVQQIEGDSGRVFANLRQVDMLAKIAEAENEHAMLGGMPIRDELGMKLFEIHKQMCQQYDRLNR